MSNVVMSVPRSIRTGSKEGPTLHVSITEHYSWIWNDKGSGSSADCTVWRPQVAPGQGYFIIGDYAQGNYNTPVGGSLVVSSVNDDPNSPLLMPPDGWVQVWNDKGSGGDYDGAIWAPTPPAGYYALGHVATAGYHAPSIAEFRCVRADLLEPTNAGSIIWADHKSGVKEDCTLFSIPLVPNAFVSQRNYAPSYQGPLFRIKLPD